MSSQPTSKPGVAGSTAPVRAPGEDLQPFADLAEYAKEYAREKPEIVAMVCFGVGFFVGWKLKPW